MNSRNYRKQQRKKKNKRKLLITIGTFALLLMVSVAYGAFQYESARTDSVNKIGAAKEIPDQISDTSLQKGLDFQTQAIENDYINVLLIGIDTEDGEKARTDTIIIAQYNPKKGTAKLASIMRDTYVSIPGYRDNKINASFFLGGPELLRKTIKENFDIDLHYYAMVNFDGFVQVVDVVAPNGIDVEIDRRMFYDDGTGKTYIDFKPGHHTLNGEQALNYVRFRSDHENDFGRVRRQQEMVTLLKDELLTVTGITRLPRLLGTITPYIDTNITTSKILSLGKDFFLNPVKDVETLTLPIPDGYQDKRIAHAGAVLKLDMEKNKQALHEFFEIEDDSSFVKEDGKQMNEQNES